MINFHPFAVVLATGVSLLSSLLVPSHAKTLSQNGISVTGTADMPLETFIGSSYGVYIDLGDGKGLQESGNFSYSLNPSLVSNGFLDFDSGTYLYNLNLLVTFPLQESMGADPVKISVLQEGSIPDFIVLEQSRVSGVGKVIVTGSDPGYILQPLLPPQPTFSHSTGIFLDPDDPVHFLFEKASFKGGGTVSEGLFNGLAYSNDWTITKIILSVPGVNLAFERTYAPAPLPLLGVGAAFGYSRKLKKRIKANKLQIGGTIAYK